MNSSPANEIQIHRATSTFQWNDPQLEFHQVKRDWHGEIIRNSVDFHLSLSSDYLWFVVQSSLPFFNDPATIPHVFTPELWKNDVAELFLYQPLSGKYLEWNLSSNGAWWQAQFSNPRKLFYTQSKADSFVRTFAIPSHENMPWRAALRIDQKFLTENIGSIKEVLTNVTFIINSPHQQFLSVADLPAKEPDFHQPKKFSKVSFKGKVEP